MLRPINRHSIILVRRMRLELTRSCDHYPLKVACIPISPPALRRNWLATMKCALHIWVAAIPPLKSKVTFDLVFIGNAIY